MITIHEVTDILVIDNRAQDWCKLPYLDHPKGCPNYDRSTLCPPKAPLVGDWINLNRHHWFIVCEFDLLSHSRGLKLRHPKWTDRQCRNLMYWQQTVRRELREAIERFTRNDPTMISTFLPEAMGVHVFRTARKLDIPIKPRPVDKVFKVALVGYPKLLPSRVAINIKQQRLFCV